MPSGASPSGSEIEGWPVTVGQGGERARREHRVDPAGCGGDALVVLVGRARRRCAGGGGRADEQLMLLQEAAPAARDGIDGRGRDFELERADLAPALDAGPGGRLDRLRLRLGAPDARERPRQAGEIDRPGRLQAVAQPLLVHRRAGLHHVVTHLLEHPHHVLAPRSERAARRAFRTASSCSRPPAAAPAGARRTPRRAPAGSAT